MLVKDVYGGYINTTYITTLLREDNRCWCNVVGENTSIEIPLETYNKLIDKYGKI